MFDDTNVQVIISSHHNSTQTQPPTPVEATVNQGVEEQTGFLKNELYAYAFQNMWNQTKTIYDEFPNMVSIPLTPSGDTALHVAVMAGSSDFVIELVNSEHMTPKDLEIKNTDGNTAFYIAVITGKIDFLQIMIVKNLLLTLIPGQDGVLPVHLAASTGYLKIVEHLCSDMILQNMNFEDIKGLFFMVIKNSMYDVAVKLVKKYKDSLSTARNDEENLTALHMLARTPTKDPFYLNRYFRVEMRSIRDDKHEGSSRQGCQLLLRELWTQVRELEHKKILELITEPSVVLFDAVKLGNHDFVKWILYMNRELLTIKDPTNGQNLLHIAVLFRQNSIFNFILKMETANLVVRAVDKDHNNILHFAARKLEAPSNLRPNIQMIIDFMWFKTVHKRVPLELTKVRNKDNKTPNDIFCAEHGNLSEEVKAEARVIAKSGMVVGALVAGISFAAALTTPGGDKGNGWFTVFMLANAIALLTSALSIVDFLSIFFFARFVGHIIVHPSRLLTGKILLFVSIAAMVIAFSAAYFLIFDIHHLVAVLVAFFGLSSVTLILLQSNIVITVAVNTWVFCVRIIDYLQFNI